MTIRPIHIIPDPVLRQKAAAVETVDDALRVLLDDMLETMYAAPGIGLAAPQVGALKRVVTIDVSGEEEEKAPLFLVNPEIVERSEERIVYQEGCLSIPEIYEDVERSARVKVRFLDRNGEPQEIEADGLLSICIKHELDHLDGVLFLDHISKLKRDMTWKKFQKQAKREGGPKPIMPTGEKKRRERPAPQAGAPGEHEAAGEL